MRRSSRDALWLSHDNTSQRLKVPSVQIGAGIWHGKHHQTARCGSEPVLNDALSCSTQPHTMVSGHGARGGRGRCYTLWRDFVTCLTKAGTTSMDVCQPEREDYMECLHHNKLVGAPSHCKTNRLAERKGAWLDTSCPTHFLCTHVYWIC